MGLAADLRGYREIPSMLEREDLAPHASAEPTDAVILFKRAAIHKVIISGDSSNAKP